MQRTFGLLRSTTALFVQPRFFRFTSTLTLMALATTLIVSPYAAAQVVALGVSKAGIKPISAATRTIPAAGVTDSFTANGITWNIWYNDVINSTTDGFDHATDGAVRRARLTDTLTYIADVLNETGTLDIVVENSETDGGGFLASAGTYNPCSDGFFGGSTLYRLVNGIKQFGGSTEEIFMTVDFGFNWNATTNAPTGGQYDLISVLLHEITHGLGLFSLSNSTGASVFSEGGCGPAFDTYMTWDTEVVTSSNANVWGGSPPSLQVNVSELTDADLFFAGTSAITGYGQGGTKPGVYAPGSFSQGSSLSHWDTGFIVGGAVMEHAINIGTQRREYTALGIGSLVDIGYSSAAATGGDPLDPINPYVTFGGSNGNGASTSPFNNLADALAVANSDATIHIAPGISNETFAGGSVVNQEVTLVNTTGVSNVSIGLPARQGEDDGRTGGFVTRSRNE